MCGEGVGQACGRGSQLTISVSYVVRFHPDVTPVPPCRRSRCGRRPSEPSRTPHTPHTPHTPQALEVREKALRALKDRLIERANIIQVRSVRGFSRWSLTGSVRGSFAVVPDCLLSTTPSRREAVLPLPSSSNGLNLLFSRYLSPTTSDPDVPPPSSSPQARLDEETTALSRHNASFNRDRDQMTQEEEEEYEKAVEESSFR